MAAYAYVERPRLRRGLRFEPRELSDLPAEGLEGAWSGAARAGRRREEVRCASGRYTRAEPYRAGEPLSDLAADAALRAAAAQASRGEAPRFPLPRAALRRKVQARARRSLVVFAVDASESMALQARMAVAKGAALALLRAAYLRRDLVAAVVFEGEGARVLLEPTPSIDRARERLRRLPVGGATPLAAGLKAAWDLVRAERLREPQLTPTLALLTDGRANVSLDARADPTASPPPRRADPRGRRGGGGGRRRVGGPARPELVEIAERLGGPLVRVGLAGAGAVVSAVRCA